MAGERGIDSVRIVSVLETLSNRVEERLPRSSLGALSRELLTIASECEQRLLP